MQYKAVIFDLDGTLIDSLQDIADACNRVLIKMAMPDHAISAYRTFIGDGLQTLIARILPDDKRTAAVIHEAVTYFKEDYADNWHVHTAMYDGIHEMLKGLVESGIHMSILSNKPDHFTRLCIDQLLPGWHFRPVFGQRQSVPQKPAPDAALEIAENLKLETKQILFVGDSEVDMQTAVNAGMDGVGVLWGFRSEEELRSHGARYLIHHPSELRKIITAEEKNKDRDSLRHLRAKQ